MAKIQSGVVPSMRRPRASGAILTVTDLASLPIKETNAAPVQTHEKNEAGPSPIEANPLAKFAPNEIAIPVGATTATPDIAELIGANDFEDDLRRANRPPSETLYVGWREKLTQCLSLAYTLYLHVLLDPEKLKRLFEDSYFSGSRERALPKKKLALAALQYVTKPDSVDDRKSASTYATMLICARHKGVTAERFPVEMAGVTLREAKAFVRGLSQKNVPEHEQAPAKPALTLLYRGRGKPHRRLLQDVSFSTDTERQRLAEQIVKILHEFQD